MSNFQKISVKARPQRTAEVLPIVVRCSPPPLRGLHSLCYAHKLRQPLRSGSVGRPTHHADFLVMEFSAGRPPAAPSLDTIQVLRRSCGLRPPLCRHWQFMSCSRFFSESEFVLVASCVIHASCNFACRFFLSSQ